MHYVIVLVKSKMAAYLETPRFEYNVSINSPVEIPSDSIYYMLMMTSLLEIFYDDVTELEILYIGALRYGKFSTQLVCMPQYFNLSYTTC
ncbi:MAG: hypothetical protein FD167_4258 [bacterium]|nr:MAG: hypothetical protein FD167_4258 [bacterium]